MPKPRPDTWRVGVTAPLKHIEPFEAALSPFVDAFSWFLADPDADEREQDEPWRLEGYARVPVDRAALTGALALAAAALGVHPPEVTIERVPDTDWVAANMRSFQPIQAKRFFVHGSHFKERVPAGQIGLVIDAGAAFGSGEHATTFGCLCAMDRLLKRRRFRRALDLGCGSGILAIAFAKAGRGARVVAADIDPVATRVAAGNARLNGVARSVRTLVSVGYENRGIGESAPYDLITANILARPLASMAADLKRHLAPGGVAILSGLLTRQERQVLAAHRLAGLVLSWRLRVGVWSTLVLTRRG